MPEPTKNTEKTFTIDKRFLLIPTLTDPRMSHSDSRIPWWGDRREANSRVTLKIDGEILVRQDLALGGAPWFWTPLELTPWRGKTLNLEIEYPEDARSAVDAIALADDLLSHIPNLYREPNRPQFHFSWRRGALGDPTAMIYYPPRKQWHMFTIHNPFHGRECCWGHAVSDDLLRWREQAPIFHHPHCIFNGVGIVDTRNLLRQIRVKPSSNE